MAVGLVDCNSFYCSCERAFHPETRGRPVVVLSNNDGCAIAFSKEAKAIGFGEMCEPFFKVKERIKEHNVAVFSSNYALYDNMSKRVMKILTQFSDDVEVYSVDEAFIGVEDLSSKDMHEYGGHIRQKILDSTGIPVGVGLSTTKVLSKIANKMSKQHKGVLVMNTEEQIDKILKDFPLRNIWGIGSASVTKLKLLGMETALDFKRFENEALIQKLLTKTGREIQDELRGIKCLNPEEIQDKKNIANTRSFGYDVYHKEELKEALATFASKAAEKLRWQKSVCFNLTAFVHTNQHKNVEQYYGIGTHNFMSGTSDTIKIIKAAHKVLDDIFRPGFAYKKGGVILNQITPDNERQIDLFNTDPDDNQALSSVIDAINNRFGPKTVKSLACGLDHNWKLNADYLSRRFTTNWNEVLRV